MIELVYDVRTKVGEEDKQGKINYKDKSYANNVNKGDIIAKYQPPKAPKPGKDIFGDIVRAINETPPTYIQGEGLVLDEKNNVFLASQEGVLIVSEDREISVPSIPHNNNKQTLPLWI